jgi:hypothetical protein
MSEYLRITNTISGTLDLSWERATDDYRLARRDGELVLQRAYAWGEGIESGGIKWKDVPIVEVTE